METPREQSRGVSIAASLRAKVPLGFLDGLPSLVDRREIPAPAVLAHHPQPTLKVLLPREPA
jgi:hypothetical protein